MARQGYTMKGPCPECQRIQFIGVCPHGMAKRIYPAPTITVEEIKEALEKSIPGAIELDKKLAQVFRPPTAAEDLYLTKSKKRKGEGC